MNGSMSIAEWCKLHSISRGQFYILQKQGETPRTFKIGTRIRISDEANDQWVLEQELKNVR